MVVNRSAPPGPIVPRLIYQDVEKAIGWLHGAFGFTERLRTTPEPDGTIHHAQMAVGQGAVILTGRAAGQKLVSPDDGGFVQTLYVSVEDADRHFERAKEYGARILNPPATHPFGERQYTAEDLEGHRWTFSQSIVDANPEDWGATIAEIKNPSGLLPRPRWCYLEVPAVDMRESISFYEKVFGWNIRGRDTPRPSFDDATGYVSGAWVTGRDIARTPGLLPYIWVDSIRATLTLVAAHGGTVVESPHLDSPGGEWIAAFRDPAGNLIGLYQEGSS